jgi:hypothetical protein
MQRFARAPFLLPLLVAACTSAPVLPEGGGAGLVAYDAAVPASTQVWGPPEWRVGDHFTLLRGGKQRIEFKVASITDEGYVLVDGLGNRLKRGRDLSNIGEWGPDGDAPLHVLTPPDVRFHWPLWIGKRWRCQYTDRTAGAQALPVESSYQVEDLDTIVTAAGTFSALRIVRTSRLMMEDGGGYLERVMVIWYAPDLGHEVRQVLGDTSVELVEWQRAEPVPK